MQSDGLRFYSIITVVILALVVVLVFAIRGLTRTITIGDDSANQADATQVDTTAQTDTAATQPAATDTGANGQPAASTDSTSTDTSTTANAHQDLINTLQAMSDSKTIFKSGSKGAQVGAIQTFLNLYNNTNTKVDNDFGPTLTAAVKAFQSKNGVPATGQVAGKTIAAMISWLQSN